MDSKPDIFLSAEHFHRFYGTYFSYYKTLDNQWKKVFVLRCLQFVSEKMITGAEGFKPDNRVKAIIAASAVQLTLGLANWKLEYFDTIIIHPTDFENKPTGLKFKGETNLQGYIRLSWRSFISGYRVGDDNINLGLHEFSHALRFNAFKGVEQDYFVEHYFDRWLAAADEAFEDIRNNRETIFRKYGGTNINEFMSVCIEHFFESPQEIKTAYPILYYCTAILLNQETINSTTRVNIRRELFKDKSAIITPVTEYNVTTTLNKTSSFKMMLVTALPLIATVFAGGIANAGTFILSLILFLFYLRLDFNYITLKIANDAIYLQKGFFLFRNRVQKRIHLSQLISFKLEEEEKGETDLELIYYNLDNLSFYSETIITKNPLPKPFLKEIMKNRVAIFKR